MDNLTDQPTDSDRDINPLLEFIAEEEESERESGPEGQGDDLQTVDKQGLARATARSLVGWVQTIFSFFSPGFIYDPGVYDQAEEKLGPVLEKHNVSDAGPLKYAQEVDAIGFGFGLIYSGMQAIKSKSKEEGETGPGLDAVDNGLGEGVDSGSSSEPFFTQ